MVSEKYILKKVVLYLMQLDDEENNEFLSDRDRDLFDEYLGQN